MKDTRTERIPIEATNALAAIRELLAESPVAVYLHGSAVDGGLRPRSDIDLLAVVDRPITGDVRKNLVTELMKISGRYPFDPGGRRPLELIVFLAEHLAPLPYPARSEFVYGEWLRDMCEAGEIPAPGSDPEYTLILAQTRENAKTLFGPHAKELLPAVSKPAVRQAIRDALPALIGTLHGDERNVLLTLARMWRTSVTGEFVPKDAAALWAEPRLPAEAAAILADARKDYLGEREECWGNRRDEVRRAVDLLQNRVVASNRARRQAKAPS